MGKHSGHIALPQNICTLWVWRDARKLQMWIALVMMANSEWQTVRSGVSQIALAPGQFMTSTRTLAIQLGCARQTLLTFLSDLESEGMIRKESSGNSHTVITIVDYEKNYMVHPDESADASEITEDNESEADITIGYAGYPTIPTRREPRPRQAKKANKSIRKGESDTTIPDSDLRNRNKRFYDDIKQSKEFWEDASLGLGVPPDILRQMGDRCFGEWLSKGNMKQTQKEVEEHLFNWLRRALEIEKSKNMTKQKENNNYDTDKIETTNFDSRRGTDASPPSEPNLPKRRFAIKNNNR